MPKSKSKAEWVKETMDLIKTGIEQDVKMPRTCCIKGCTDPAVDALEMVIQHPLKPDLEIILHEGYCKCHHQELLRDAGKLRDIIGVADKLYIKPYQEEYNTNAKESNSKNST